MNRTSNSVARAILGACIALLSFGAPNALAASITITGDSLSEPSGRTFWGVRDASGAQIIINKRGDDTVELPDGTYTIITRNNDPYGTVTVEGDIVTAVTGALTTDGGATVGFELPQLTGVLLPFAGLSEPAGRSNAAVYGDGSTGQAITTWHRDDTRVYVPRDTQWRIRLRSGEEIGQFNVNGDGAVDVSGPLLPPTGGGAQAELAFDFAGGFARVEFSFGTLTEPAEIIFGSVAGAPLNRDNALTAPYRDTMALYLPPDSARIQPPVDTGDNPGGYRLRLRDGTLVGYFSVGDDLTVTSLSPTVQADPGGALTFDRSALAEVTFGIGELSMPAERVAVALASPGPGDTHIARTWRTDYTAWLPPGDYELEASRNPNPYGTFTVTGDRSILVGSGFGSVADGTGTRLNVIRSETQILPLAPINGQRYALLNGDDIHEVLTIHDDTTIACLPEGDYVVRYYDAASQVEGSDTITLAADQILAPDGSEIDAVPAGDPKVNLFVDSSFDILASKLTEPAGRVSLTLSGPQSQSITRDATVEVDDGLYTIRTRGAQGTYGTFEVIKGVPTNPTGFVLIDGDGNVDFDLDGLTRVTLDVSSLTEPEGTGSLSIPNVAGFLGGDGAVYLPPNNAGTTYATSDRSGRFQYGEFSVSQAGAVTVDGGGTLVLNGLSDIGFDRNQLTEIIFDAGDLSEPDGFLSLGIPETARSTRSVWSVFLPEPTTPVAVTERYSLSTYGGFDIDSELNASIVPIASFDCSPGFFCDGHVDALILTSVTPENGTPTAFEIRADTSVLTQVTLLAGGLSFPTPELTRSGLRELSLTYTDTTLYLAPNTRTDRSYEVIAANSALNQYGTFFVEPDGTITTTGALVQTSTGVLDFDTCELNLLQVTSDGSNQRVDIYQNTKVLTGTETIALPDGNYILNVIDGAGANTQTPFTLGDGSDLPDVSGVTLSIVDCAVDECAAGTATCDPNATCQDTPDSYTCTCSTGYEGDGQTCGDTDGCAANTTCISSGDTSAVCVDVEAPGEGFSCACSGGFSNDAGTCADIDECADGSAGCAANASCANTAGAYICTCGPGTTGDGVVCADTDACANAVDTCATETLDTIPAGSAAGPQRTFPLTQATSAWTYVVRDTVDGFSNPQVTWSEGPSAFADGSASLQADTVGTTTQACEIRTAYKDYFVGDLAADAASVTYHYTCETDVSQFFNGAFIAVELFDAAGTSLGRETRALSTCLSPFFDSLRDTYVEMTGTGDADTYIVGFDEIAPDANVARVRFMMQNYACIGTNSSTVDQIRVISHAPGDTSCTDAASPGGTAACQSGGDSGASCMDAAAPDNGFSCVCSSGFEPDADGYCADVDECAASPCLNGGTCLNNDGGFSCSCNPGFEGDLCDQDIDECTNGTANCDANADCINTQGDFVCSCNSGFEGTGETCSDIDDCDPNPCNGGTCTDTGANTFTCDCLPGLEGDLCDQDIDGCATGGTASCGSNGDTAAACTDILAPGTGFTCNCSAGYQDVSGVCTDIDGCSAANGNGDATCPAGSDSAAACEDAPAPASGSDFTCICSTGFADVDGVCQDVDECATGANGCHENASCTNTEGGFSCSCDPGYDGDGFMCTNTDDCAANPCANGTCTDGIDSFSCDCGPGFEGDLCDQDIDGCATGGTASCGSNGDSGAACTDVSAPGTGFTCDCSAGYQDVSGVCTDIDGCSAANGNTSCASGGDSAAACEDASAPASGSDFTCICSTGFADVDGVCQDVDECATGANGCHENASCTNTEGGFSCSCDPGYDGDGITCTLDICEGDDSVGDVDGDGVCDDIDPCAGFPNLDADGDGVCNSSDVCPTDPDNVDDDSDGVCDADDVCIGTSNVDDDGDNVCNENDLCEGVDASGDADSDGFCDANDNCPNDANPDQADSDGDNIGDVCEDDSDTDGIPNDEDNCPEIANADQSDIDLDGIGDVCDDDDDDDGIADPDDNCPAYANADQADFDHDGFGDVCDGDDDADGVADDADVCPGTPIGALFDAAGCSGPQRIELRCGVPSDYTGNNGNGFGHGQWGYFQCVVREARAAWHEGLITKRQRSRIVWRALWQSLGKYHKCVGRWR